MKRTNFVGLALAGLACLAATGCTNKAKQTAGADDIKRDQGTVSEQQSIYGKAQPVPLFEYSQTRQVLIEALRAQTTAVATWTVFMALDGTPLYTCPSLGFPVAADAQLTNPLSITRIATGGGATAEGVIEQPEPNGVYSSKNTTATYVVCVRSGQNAIVYWEPPVAAFPFEVRIDNGRIVDGGGKASITVDSR